MLLPLYLSPLFLCASVSEEERGNYGKRKQISQKVMTTGNTYLIFGYYTKEHSFGPGRDSVLFLFFKSSLFSLN